MTHSQQTTITAANAMVYSTAQSQPYHPCPILHSPHTYYLPPTVSRCFQIFASSPKEFALVLSESRKTVASKLIISCKYTRVPVSSQKCLLVYEFLIGQK